MGRQAEDDRIGLIHDMSRVPSSNSIQNGVLLESLERTSSCIHLCCHHKNPRFAPLMELLRLVT